MPATHGILIRLVRQAFRYELDPTNVQRTSLAQHAGAARFAFNWGLAERRRMLDEGEGSTSAHRPAQGVERL